MNDKRLSLFEKWLKWVNDLPFHTEDDKELSFHVIASTLSALEEDIEEYFNNEKEKLYKKIREEVRDSAYIGWRENK